MIFNRKEAVEEFCKQSRERGNKPHYVDRVRRTLKILFNFLEKHKLNENFLITEEKWADKFMDVWNLENRNLKSSSIHGKTVHIRTYLKWVLEKYRDAPASSNALLEKTGSGKAGIAEIHYLIMCLSNENVKKRKISGEETERDKKIKIAVGNLRKMLKSGNEDAVEVKIDLLAGTVTKKN
jgi:site-specific recombinase XerD